MHFYVFPHFGGILKSIIHNNETNEIAFRFVFKENSTMILRTHLKATF